MSERKLAREGLNDIAPNNSDKAARSKNIDPNQTKNPKERKKLEPIVKGAVRQKLSFMDKVKGSFTGGGGSIGEFLVYDILVPAFRDTAREMGFGIIEMFLGGGRGRGRDYDTKVVRDRGRSYVSYNAVSGRDGRGGRNDDRRGFDQGDRARHDFDNIVYTSRAEAEDVLSHLVDLIMEYGEATVAAFYELSRIESNYTDNNYGWTNLRDAYTDRVRNGYIIHFPRARPL